MIPETTPNQNHEADIAHRAAADYTLHKAGVELTDKAIAQGHTESVKFHKADEDKHLQESRDWQMGAQNTLEAQARQEMEQDRAKRAP